MEQTSKKIDPKIDVVKKLRDIRDKMSLEIMNMNYEQERAYLDKILAKKDLLKTRNNDTIG